MPLTTGEFGKLLGPSVGPAFAERYEHRDYALGFSFDMPLLDPAGPRKATLRARFFWWRRDLRERVALWIAPWLAERDY